MCRSLWVGRGGRMVNLGVPLASLRGHFGVILGLNLAYQDDFGALCEPFRRRKALDGTCDGYMLGLGGAEKRKC